LNIVDAVEKGDLKLLKRLVEGGAAVNAMHGAWTALMLAAANRNIEAIHHLLRNGATTEIKYGGNPPHLTALGWAAGYGYTDVARVLIDHGANVNAKDDDGTTLLMHIMVRKPTADVVRLLLENGADPDATAHNGVTALMIATHKGHEDIANVLRAFSGSRYKAELEKIQHLFLNRDYDACARTGLEIIATQSVQHELLQLTLISLLRCKFRGPWITPHFRSNATNASVAESFVFALTESNPEAWQSLLLRLTIGTIEVPDVLKDANGAIRRCQAHFYYGARLVSIGRTRDAAGHFQAALDQRAECFERGIAQSEIQAARAAL
jgi:uncharacterized protein